ncbi:hypothetical protein ONE63_011370 [Megalurothrips usitatus]|uniref:Uncharacterized protein n=1 Tax=Megalurothrips usitatus TaxID=439358 RepID=A0AAV7X068_9NEOP|nr:hypothetical protein ONE63_011370 [Megalurothrips usitatus]
MEDLNIISAYTCGTQFISENHLPKEIHLLVYQDAVNAVMRALGSAKNKYKMLTMYFNLGNYRPHIRARVDTKYVVLLVRESVFKDIGKEKCFGSAIQEFQKLESEGIIYKEENVKVVVEFTLGDSLGQRGFIESFSAIFFCRFCPIKRTEFKANPHITKPQRTVAEYNHCVFQANLTDTHCMGVKENSMFNSLKYFHATSHLVPCLAHDLFEGVVTWDLAGIIRHFVEKRYFTYKLLNRRIKTFQCVKGDAPNKPAYVLPNGKKLGGHAVQNWTLLRLFPFIIGDKVTDYEEPGWKLYLLLKELCEYFCAPALHKTDIPYLKDVLLPAYFETRSVLDQDKYRLKPKHHFMAHYPELTLKYGLLLYLWTLSYKQAHKFFKLVMRMSKNF